MSMNNSKMSSKKGVAKKRNVELTDEEILAQTPVKLPMNPGDKEEYM